MKPKSNIKDVPKRDRCQTPPYALSPLWEYLDRDSIIWEPAAGEGYLVREFRDRGFDVIASDILGGQDFFCYEPSNWDVIITNPPYSTKYRWLERCYFLDKAFALLLPVEVLGTKSAQSLFKKYGFSVVLLNKRVNFKMPDAGWSGGGAQYPTAWFTHKLGVPQQVVFKTITRTPPQQRKLFKYMSRCKQLTLGGLNEYQGN